MTKEDIYEKYNKKWQTEPIRQKECMMQMLQEWGEIYHEQKVKNCSIPDVRLSLPTDEQIQEKANAWYPPEADKSYPSQAEERKHKRYGYNLGMTHLRDDLKRQ